MNNTIRNFLSAALMLCSAVLSAQTGHYAIKLQDFTELKVTDGINVDYVCAPDSAGYAVFDAVESVASRIMFSPSGSKITVQLASEDEMHPTPPNTPIPTVRIYSRYLSSVENDGDSLVRILSVAPGPKFKAKLMGNGRLSVRDVDFNEVNVQITTGNGTVTITGRCDTAVLGMLATGNIVADCLEAVNVKCRLTGTGTIGCNATRSLQVRGVGTGKIYYVGKPEISKRAPGITVAPL